MRLLHIDASARHDGSHSRYLSEYFVKNIKARVHMVQIDRLDLASDTPRHFGALQTAAISVPVAEHTPEMREAISVSDAIVARVLAADGIVIGTPIYNFGMPSTLKAFFDHVSRNGKTFVADATGMRGLLGDKKVVILSAAGGAYGPGEMFEGLDCLTPHVKAILGFLGVRSPDFISARPTMFAGPDAANVSMAKAKHDAETVADAWARSVRLQCSDASVT